MEEPKLIDLKEIKDSRGSFTKIYNSTWQKEDLDSNNIHEIYITSSRKNVIRGIHFQIPPFEQKKYITCIEGTVLDVLIDLRKNGNYGKIFVNYLSEENPQTLEVPSGFGHGFLSISEFAKLTYGVTSSYSPKHDVGIRWDSIGYDWLEIKNPIVSDRDLDHPVFEEFITPF